MSRDRKDVPDNDRDAGRAESMDEAALRRRAESVALDKALEETFPTSDPVSPFVPAIGSHSTSATDASTPADHVPRQSCRHQDCRCMVPMPGLWCSDLCRDTQQGFAHQAGAACHCGHAECEAHAQATAVT